MNKKILVLSENYPNSDEVSMQYVHSRNVQYLKYNIEVDVLSFRAKNTYEIDNINVMIEEDMNINKLNQYDKILSHAPNLKNHIRFLNKVKDKSKIIFFFHGHEVMDTKKHYPKPFDFIKKNNPLKRFIKSTYDVFKLKYWKYIGLSVYKESELVFVSDWMYKTFLEDIGIKSINNTYHIIHNTIGKHFQDNQISNDEEKIYDVVTIRSFYDHAKYGIDLVAYQAEQNPDLNFHVFGKGKYFDFHKKPDNLTIHNQYLNHSEIMEVLDKTHTVYLPTRLDAQGVLACEIASYGSKMITSDIPICRELLTEFINVYFISNDFKEINFSKILSENTDYVSQNKFNFENTVLKEIELIKG